MAYSSGSSSSSSKGKKSFVSRTTRYRIQREKESSTCVSEADLDDYGLYVPCDSEPFDFYIRPTEEGCGDRSSFVKDSYPAKYDFESETSESDGDECDGASTPTQVEWYGSVPAESEHDDIAHVHDRPLFEGSPITTSANNVLVMEYSCRVSYNDESHGTIHVYPYMESDPCGPERTHEDTIDSATKATAESNVEGVKGPSWLAAIPHYDIIRGTTVDYMHAVLLGVCRQLLKLWLDSRHNKELWYLGNKLDELDRRLCSIKPPSEVKRIPRSIRTTRKYWKAHELRAWLLHYSPLVIHGVIQETYYQHHLLLVEAIYLLLQNSIHKADITYASELLNKYCFLFSPLYGACHMSANVHGLLHLPKVVQDLGPLWTISCFPYEAANGEILKLFHGSQGVDKQVVKRLCDLQILADIAKSTFPADSHEMILYLSMHQKQRNSMKTKIPVTDDITILGKPFTNRNLDEKELDILRNQLDPSDCYSVHPQLLIVSKNRVITTCSASKATKRIDYCISYKVLNSSGIINRQAYGLLQRVVTTKSESYSMVIPLTEATTRLCNDSIASLKLHRHYIPFLPPRSDDLTMIRTSTIIDKCIYLDALHSHGLVFVSEFPNCMESE